MASKSRRLSGRRLSGKTGGGSSRRLSGLPDPDELENQENSGMGANNDELEMRERRNTKKRNRRRSGRFSLGGRGLKNLLLPGEGEQTVLTESELTSMYKATIEMSTQNKINSKNAFQLQLIDRIDDVVNVVTGGGDGTDSHSNFQHAGCVVEAAAKIYDARVDETYKGTQRFCADLVRSAGAVDSGGANGADGTDGADADGATGEGRTGKAKASKKLGLARTLETNVSNINIRKSDLECDVDPLFEKMSQRFDEGGARGMLLGNMPVSGGPRIVFGSAEASGGDDEDIAEEGQAAPAPAPAFFTFSVDTEAICRASSAGSICTDTAVLYAGYKAFDNLAAGHDGIEVMPQPDQSQAFASLGSDDEEDGGYDSNGGAGFDGDDFGDGGGDDDFYGDDLGSSSSSSSSSMSAQHGGAAPMAANESVTAYNYYAIGGANASSPGSAKWADKKANWAGPGHSSHWKLFSGTKSRGGGKSNGSSKPKEPKVVFHVDFSAEPINVDVAFAGPKRSKSSTCQSKASLAKFRADLSAYLLPEDAHYGLNDLHTLFFRPKAFVRGAHMSAQGGNSASDSTPSSQHGDYGDDGADDNWGDDGAWGDHAFGETSDPNAPDNFYSHSAGTGDLDLLEDANVTEKIDIGYATTRKVFDIRQLKGEFWNTVRTEAPIRPAAKDVFEVNAGSSDKAANKALAGKKHATASTVQDVFTGAASFRGTLNQVCVAVCYFVVCDSCMHSHNSLFSDSNIFLCLFFFFFFLARAAVAQGR